MFDADSVSKAVAVINGALKPIAERPVDINDPNWVEKLRTQTPPLDQAGVRTDAEALMRLLIDAYSEGPEKQRQIVRNILAQNRAFTWATGMPEPPTTVSTLRIHLLRLSAENGGGDMRDTIMSVESVCSEAIAAGVNVVPVLKEVANLSSNVMSLNIGSMRTVLERAAEKYAKIAR